MHMELSFQCLSFRSTERQQGPLETLTFTTRVGETVVSLQSEVYGIFCTKISADARSGRH
jgi:hypothetical protein